MRWIDPEGPIDKLRIEMIDLITELALKSKLEDRKFLLGQVLPLIRANDAYLRIQADRLVRTAQSNGIRIDIKRH
jgi:hypothetical protein